MFKYLWLTLFVGTIWAANAALARWGIINMPLYAVPAGTLFAGIAFATRDLLRETGGRRWVVIAILLGAGLSFILEDSRKFAIASGVAFTLGELIDAGIYELLRSKTRIGAGLASNLAGATIDTFVFLPLAFGGIAFWQGLLFWKFVASIPFLGLLAWTKRDLPKRGNSAKS